MSTTISQALATRFDKHRIVFWYDANAELRDEFDALELPDVEKIVLENNEFGVKYQVLREEPKKNFLIYHEGPKPEKIDNWLLDVLLAHDEFRADKVGMWLNELNLGIEFAELITKHSGFFQAAARRDSLKVMLTSTDSEEGITLKLIAATTKADPRLDAVLEKLLRELASERTTYIDQLGKYALDECLWSKLHQEFGYHSDAPSVEDFAINLFESCFAESASIELKKEEKLSNNACVFFKRWKNHVQFSPDFKALSELYEKEVLNVGVRISNLDFRDLLEADAFRVIDQKILSDLVAVISDQTASVKDITNWIAKRKETYWYSDFKHMYKAVEYAALFFAAVEAVNFHYENMVDAVHSYSSEWFKVDLYYRKYTYHAKASGQASLLNALSDKINGVYSNSYLLKLNDSWQQDIDVVSEWNIDPEQMQRRFFRRHVLPYLKQNKKVCVIISDGLRFEAGAELQRLIRKEDKFEAQLHTGISMLPSYTQLGMAALLPNRELEIKADTSSTVFVDGANTRGLDARRKVLSTIDEKVGTAIKAKDLMALNKDEARALFREHDVVYVYHNVIDSTGDKAETEDKVFEAVETCHEELLQLVKKLVNANASNLFITADHGFIYQANKLDESEYSSAEISGGEVLFKDRRFILGRGLNGHSSVKKFTASQLGLVGDLDILIPKSINRLGNKGDGSRYVHGGASLQEVVVPVLHVNKKRKGDVSVVDVEILRGAGSVITTGQHTVVFYQTDAVTEKMHGRELRAGLYAQDGTLISEQHMLVFDNPLESPRDRERKQQFILSSEADKENGKEVVLKLEERHGKTSHYKEYKYVSYKLLRSIGNDFGNDFGFDI